jgi:hypothetical protein
MEAKFKFSKFRHCRGSALRCNASTIQRFNDFPCLISVIGTIDLGRRPAWMQKRPVSKVFKAFQTFSKIKSQWPALGDFSFRPAFSYLPGISLALFLSNGPRNAAILSRLHVRTTL